MPNVDVLGPLQQAQYDRMTGDATLMGKVTGVFDRVPEGTAFPYVQLGEQIATPQGAHDRYGRRTVFTLHVWSAHDGFSEAYGIVDDLLRLFELQDLTVAGHHTVVVRHVQTVTMRDPDGDLRHVAVRFAAETENDAAF